LYFPLLDHGLRVSAVHSGDTLYYEGRADSMRNVTEACHVVKVSRLAEMTEKCHSKSMKECVVEIDSEKMGGAPVFRGTRVPVQTLLDYIEGDQSVEEFLEDFPTVTRKQVFVYLETANKMMVAEAV
jgi:uncharacterized protein (DUF433 family)